MQFVKTINWKPLFLDPSEESGVFTFTFFTIRQRSCWKGIFSQVIVCHSVILFKDGGSHVTITHDTLDLTVHRDPLPPHPSPICLRTWILTVQGSSSSLLVTSGGRYWRRVPTGMLSCWIFLAKSVCHFCSGYKQSSSVVFDEYFYRDMTSCHRLTNLHFSSCYYSFFIWGYTKWGVTILYLE